MKHTDLKNRKIDFICCMLISAVKQGDHESQLRYYTSCKPAHFRQGSQILYNPSCSVVECCSIQKCCSPLRCNNIFQSLFCSYLGIAVVQGANKSLDYGMALLNLFVLISSHQFRRKGRKLAGEEGD